MDKTLEQLQKEKDELEKKLKDLESKSKEPDINSMSLSELKDLTKELLKSKREANDEAKNYRLKLESLEKAEAEEKEKKRLEDMTLEDKLKEKDRIIEQKEKEILSTRLKSEALAELTEKGFKPNLIDRALGNLTEENYKNEIKAFEKEFEDYKVKPDGKPTTSFYPKNGAKNDTNKEPAQPNSTLTTGTAAFNEIMGAGQ